MSKKYNFVYKTTNNLNGDYYYGVHSTNNLDDGYLGSGKRIIRSINKYGESNFTREIVQYFSNVKNAYSLERAIVTPELLLDKHCLNLATGGHGGGVPGHKCSGETRQKMSHPHNVSDENREKLSKIGKSNTGRKPWNKGKTGVQQSWNKGKNGIYSEDALNKMRKPKTEEHKQKLREANLGKHWKLVDGHRVWY